MSFELLQTKMFILPILPNFISRPHLMDRISRKLDQGCKGTLISAPAGFGKTSLVTNWLHQTDYKTAWLSLEEGDDDPAKLLTYFYAALHKTIISTSDSVQEILESPHHLNIKRKLETLINDDLLIDLGHPLWRFNKIV